MLPVSRKVDPGSSGRLSDLCESFLRVADLENLGLEDLEAPKANIIFV